VAKLIDAFDTSAVAFGVRFKGVAVKDVESLRRALPESAKMIIAKNTLVKLAAEKAAGEWEAINPAAALDNAWIFADEDALAPSVKAYLAFRDKLQERLPKEERATTKLTDVSGGVLEGRFMTAADVAALKNMPTKAELMQKVAVLIKRVPTKLALAVKAVPRKVAYGVKALADGDDDTTKTVGDVFPKAS
jgi:large subunit ribosomal protein L10